VFERWIKLFGDTCGELFEDPLSKLSRKSRDPRAGTRRLTKCVVLDGRGFIRQDKWSSNKLSPCLGYRNLRQRN
jgi:hypothetical protein